MTIQPSHRGGSGSPMVLIHGFTATWRVWQPVLPELERHHDVFAPTLMGHHGGLPYAAGSPANGPAIADALERTLDENGIEQAHLVGNSLGGWLALELAARGRALSTVALAPAGGFPLGGREQRRLSRYFRLNYKLLTRVGDASEGLMRRPRFRAVALRDVVSRPSAVPGPLAAEMLAGVLACELYLPFLDVAFDGTMSELGPIEGPVRIVWGTKDRILHWPGYAVTFRESVPNAEWVELPGLGHCPQLDDPPATARTVLELTRRVDAEQSQPAPAG